LRSFSDEAIKYFSVRVAGSDRDTRSLLLAGNRNGGVTAAVGFRLAINMAPETVVPIRATIDTARIRAS
jgi:hypothetical protein